jgi:hypothetical protein
MGPPEGIDPVPNSRHLKAYPLSPVKLIGNNSRGESKQGRPEPSSAQLPNPVEDDRIFGANQRLFRLRRCSMRFEMVRGCG